MQISSDSQSPEWHYILGNPHTPPLATHTGRGSITRYVLFFHHVDQSFSARWWIVNQNCLFPQLPCGEFCSLWITHQQIISSHHFSFFRSKGSDGIFFLQEKPERYVRGNCHRDKEKTDIWTSDQREEKGKGTTKMLRPWAVMREPDATMWFPLHCRSVYTFENSTRSSW